ncbi:hypothetical protein AVEN_131942-1 [Araneus ventricosus]|uniref:Uncharacterized protein n=1 Tax=Araneus ventricosus TaxID=182803 RepID=A0A4Y2B2H7_ARAVE|nr:hypothetical protein AVEN_131942-1 [Araneus ventricosus]
MMRVSMVTEVACIEDKQSFWRRNDLTRTHFERKTTCCFFLLWIRFCYEKESTNCSKGRLDPRITVKIVKTKAGYHMYRPKGSQGRLPPLLSVSPVGGRNSSKYRSRSPSASASKYHSKCCLPTRPPSPGPGDYLEGLSCKMSVRSSKSSRTAKRHGRSQSQDWSQIVTDYLKKHEEFLEHYILENVPLDLLERLVIRKIRRQGQYADEMAETNEVVPNLSRWKFCVHADKREMLREMTSTLFSYPNKVRVLTELANTVASAVNASDWRLHIYDADTKKLCSFGSNNEHLSEFEIEDTLADYVMKTKETVRCKSTERAKRTGNCFLLNLNVILLSEGMRGIRGIKYVSPFSEPMRFASIMLRCNLVTIKRVPLHKPFVGAKFRNNIIMHPGFKFNLYGGSGESRIRV